MKNLLITNLTETEIEGKIETYLEDVNNWLDLSAKANLIVSVLLILTGIIFDFTWRDINIALILGAVAFVGATVTYLTNKAIKHFKK